MKIAEILEIADKRTAGTWEWLIDRFRGGYSGLYTEAGEPVCVPNCANDGDEGAAWFEDYLTESDAKYIATATIMESKLRAMQELMPEIKDYLEYAKFVSGNYGEVAFSMKVMDLLTKLEVWENE